MGSRGLVSYTQTPQVCGYKNINMDVHIGQVIDRSSGLETSTISQTDLETLKKMLPELQQKSGNLSQVDIIMEAIEYIKRLQGKLQS